MGKLAIITGVSFVLSLALVKLLIVLLNRWGMRQVIREEMPESHQKKGKTPVMGGLGFFIAAVAVTLAAGGFSNSKVRAVLLISTISFLIGLADDLSKIFRKNTKGLGARYKLAIQIGLGALLGYFMVWQGTAPGLVRVPFVGEGGVDFGKLFIPFVIFVYVGTMNSVNFTDGVDGLLAGCFLIVAVAFIFLINRTSDYTLIPMLCAVCGAVAAYLWFNSNPAAIFMGDSGSLFLGGLLASVSVVTRSEIFLAVAGLLFVVEMLSVIVQVVSFRLTGKRVFKMAPIHHHFQLSGWSEAQVSQRFWIASAVFSGIGLALFLP